MGSQFLDALVALAALFVPLALAGAVLSWRYRRKAPRTRERRSTLSEQTRNNTVQERNPLKIPIPYSSSSKTDGAGPIEDVSVFDYDGVPCLRIVVREGDGSRWVRLCHAATGEVFEIRREEPI